MNANIRFLLELSSDLCSRMEYWDELPNAGLQEKEMDRACAERIARAYLALYELIKVFSEVSS